MSNIEKHAIDLNLIVVCGKIATEVERKQFESGTRYLRYLVTVKSEVPRRRVDVLAITHWDPDTELWENPGERGDRFWACGSVQRRFWESPDEGRRSRFEVIAEQVNIKPVESEMETVDGRKA